MSQPIGISDDYGNLILSTGLAHQQRPHEMQGLPSSQEEIMHQARREENSTSSRLRPGTVSRLATAPLSVKQTDAQLGRPACVTCHERKVKCDLYMPSSTCSNCTKAGRTDCRPHRRRERGSGRQKPSRPSSESLPRGNFEQSLSMEIARSFVQDQNVEQQVHLDPKPRSHPENCYSPLGESYSNRNSQRPSDIDVNS